MFHQIFIFAVLALVFCAFGDPTIVGSIRMQGRRYAKGDEEALRAVMTPEQHADWQQRGLIEGDWQQEPSLTNQALPPGDAETYQRIVDALDPLREDEDESIADAVERLIEANDLAAGLDAERLGAVTDRSAMQVERDAMKQRAEGAEAELATARGKFQTLENEKASLSVQLTELKGNYDGLFAEKERLAGEVSRLTTELDKAKKKPAST